MNKHLWLQVRFPRGIAAAAYAKNMPPAYFLTLRGHPRRAVGSMRVNRRKAQQTTKNSALRKEDAILVTGR